MLCGTANTFKERIIGVIPLNRSNKNGGWYFISLRTDIIWNTNYFWLDLCPSYDIIERVENITKQESGKSELEATSMLTHKLKERMDNDFSDNFIIMVLLYRLETNVMLVK